MRLAVVGTGLMGGSFALGARAAKLFDEVVGVEPDGARGRRALDLAVVDRLADAVPQDADGVLLAVPSHAIAPWVAELADHPGVIFDLGSVKQGVLEAVRARCGAVPSRFVPCHPLAGSEKSGPEAASETLYRDAEVIVTPVEETDGAAVARVRHWWRSLGSRVVEMSAAEHDQVLAVTSHLPHLVAFCYLQQVGDEHLPHTAGGFRDFTRIGAAEAAMWSPIFSLNRQPVLEALDRLQSDLTRARSLIEAGDRQALDAFIEAAAVQRRKLGNGL